MANTKPRKPSGISPERIVVNCDSEDAHQMALFCWCALNVGKYPELKWFHAIPNGGFRDPRTAAKLVAAGVKKGVSDCFLPVKRGRFSGLYIELKRPDLKPKTEKAAGGVSPEQREFGFFVQQQDFGFVVAYGWEEAKQFLEQYLNY